MRLPSKVEVIVAGHICLDVIPDLGATGLDALLIPGKLVNVGEAVTATGGTVANTGLALHRLGVPTRLMGKVGRDLFGRAILDLLEQYGSGLTESMIIREGEQSSYSIVISPRGSDRIFFHCPGTNDTFGADDVDYDQLVGARLFHFGYPPLMKRMFADDGREMELMLSRVKARGLIVSLDLSRPDPDSEAGKVDWRSILTRVLPQVDLFLPSMEEILFMLDRERFDASTADGEGRTLIEQVDGALLSSLSEQLLQMGAAVVAIKLGDQGLYVRTTNEKQRIEAICGGISSEVGNYWMHWLDRELLVPCFEVKVAGTTGAGDCTIAGFLSGLLHGLTLEETMIAAVGTGACNVEAIDATSGIPSWTEVLQRISDGWERNSVILALPAWKWDSSASVWTGPHDRVI